MTPSQLRQWAFQKSQPDQWWLSLDAVTEEIPVTVSEIERLIGTGDYALAQVLHVSQGDMANPVWFDVTMPATVVAPMSAASVGHLSREAEMGAERARLEAECVRTRANVVQARANLDLLTWGDINPKLVCPHCQTVGKIHVKLIKQKKGISGAKATGALLTGGISMLATGLSRKEQCTQAHCGECNSTWTF